VPLIRLKVCDAVGAFLAATVSDLITRFPITSSLLPGFAMPIPTFCAPAVIAITVKKIAGKIFLLKHLYVCFIVSFFEGFLFKVL